MEKNILVVCSGLALAVALVVGYNKFTSPSNYEDCILETIGEVEDGQTAMIKAAACRAKFPKKYLTDEEVFGKNN